MSIDPPNQRLRKLTKRLLKKSVWFLAGLGWLAVTVCCAGEPTAIEPLLSGKTNGKLEAVVEPAAYRGWKSHRLSNGLVEVQIVPEIGGRAIQYKLGDHEFFWVNPDLAGKTPPPSGLGPNGEWLNYGGDKLWPAPQGWGSEEQWPGPPDAMLDGSPHRSEVLVSGPTEAAVRLRSREDQRSGIQFIRTVRLFEGTTRVACDVTMKNIDRKPRRWGIWTVTQVDGTRRDGKGFNPDLVAWCPVNPRSRFLKGYNILFGAVDNPTFQLPRDSKILRLQYQYKVGKIALDSAAGWTATVNGASGDVFVQRFHFELEREYPDGASVEFWSSGLGSIRAWGKDVEMKNDVRETPSLIECELISPFARLQPGESYSWRYEWYACNLGGNFPARDCNTLGVISEPLAMHRSGTKVRLTGRFGVFQRGVGQVHFLDASGQPLGAGKLRVSASPLVPLVLNAQEDLPANAEAVALSLQSVTGRALGELARTKIQRP